MKPLLDIKQGPLCTNNNDGNKSGPQRSSTAAPSPVFHHPSLFPPLFPRLASYAYFRLPAGIEGQEGAHRATTEGKHESRAGTLLLNFSWLDTEARASNKIALCVKVYRYETSLFLGDKIYSPP